MAAGQCLGMATWQVVSLNNTCGGGANQEAIHKSAFSPLQELVNLSGYRRLTRIATVSPDNA